jgi:hypothetical protein
MREQVILAYAPVGNLLDTTPMVAIELHEIAVRNVHPGTLVKDDIGDRKTVDWIGTFPDVVYLPNERIDEIGADESRCDDVAILAPLAQHRCVDGAEFAGPTPAPNSVGPILAVIPRELCGILLP